ncbi:MAG: DUF2470 domain-containing protein [Marmoricola sp.]
MTDGSRSEPSLAQQARTALAQARVGSLIGRSAPSSRSVTVVKVTDQPDGQPVVELEPGSSIVRLLAWWPVVTVSVAGPGPFKALHLTGTAKGQDPLDERLRAYRLQLLSTRLVNTTSVTVPLGEFKAADPDPLWRQAPEALRHLGEAHAPELLACIRAHGFPDAEAVVPRTLDRYGLELAAIGEDGIRTVRLPFPGGPVRSLQEVTNGLRVLLTCRCGTCRHRSREG